MDDLISEFITETSESLGLLDQELVRLEQNPNDKEILGNIFRLVHTIKGTCGFLGLPRLESVAHAGENVLGKIRDGVLEVTPEAISIVLAALDRIKDIMEFLSANGHEPEGDDSEIIKNLNAFADSVARAPKPMPAPVLRDEPLVSSEEMDALERAFLEAAPTMEGGMDFTRAPDIDWDAVNATQGTAVVPATPELAPAPVPVKEKAVKPPADDSAKDAAAANQSIRVNLDVLENLMQMVGELVLTRNQLLQATRNHEERELKGPLQQLSHITTELQEGIMKTRMQPISNAWSKFPRLIRDLSGELGKKIELKMIGEHTELDRQLLEMIKDPLTHMVRNSCDHGLEMPADRVAAGKPEVGTVTLAARHEGGHSIIEIRDDGRGINIDRVTKKAIENGLATAEEIAAMSNDQILQFIFRAGFSTAEKVTAVSGRGVGMDVVRTNIEKIGGNVSLSSVPGKGSIFHIKIPLTLAIVSVLIVETDGQCFGLPQLNVVELVAIGDDGEYTLEDLHGAKVLRLREKLLPLVSLRTALGLPLSNESSEHYVAVIRVGSSEFGLLVERIHDTEEIVVKPVSRVLEHLVYYSGTTILGDGSVILILEPNGLARAVGDSDLAQSAGAPSVVSTNHERLTSFLVFKAGTGVQKAVPLELVSRLEEIDVSRLEYSSGEPILQYRGDLMRVKMLDGQTLPESGLISLVAFSYDGRVVGLAVDEIIDIVMTSPKIMLQAENDRYLGSLVIHDKTTDVLDIGFLLQGSGTTHEAAGDALQNVSLLYVEDSMFFRNLTLKFFQEQGLRVTAAASAKEALALLMQTPDAFNVIVTDIEMPEMNGFEFAATVQGDPRFVHLPIYAFTSTVNDDVLVKAGQCGMCEVVNKTDRARLMQLIALTHPQQEAA